MILPIGDELARQFGRHYAEYTNVNLGLLRDSEEVVHRSAADYDAGIFWTRHGSLILTPERILFLAPPHTVARWRNCVVSLPLTSIRQADGFNARLKWLPGFRGKLTIVMDDGRRYVFFPGDAVEWRGAIFHQCELAGHSIAN